MTLIVGYASDDVGFLVGDTLLHFDTPHPEQKKPINGQAHTLKVRILNPDIAVAFSASKGNVEVALELIQALQSALAANHKLDASEFLFESYRQIGSPECDFLILQLAERGPQLTQIQSGKRLICERAYIGGQNEYRQLQQLIDSNPFTPHATQLVIEADGTQVVKPNIMNEGDIYFMNVSTAMMSLTAQWNSQSTIGAICSGVTRVRNAKISGKLEYLQSYVATISSAEGASGFYWYASNTEVRGMAIYYPLGKIGYLFIVGDREHSRTEIAETQLEFIRLAKQKYSLNLE